MKTGTLLGLLVPTLLVTASAFAQDKAACLDAVSKGQTLRDAHKLVEAREQLRVCASAQCPAAVQGDCANWLAEVEKALPSVVATAKNRAGADLVDVKVSLDGKPFVAKLDGQAVSMNAGPHTFHFEGADGASFDQQVLVKEGEKNQPVAVVLGAPPAPPAPPTSPPARAADAGSSSSSSSSPLRTVGWIAGGVGIAGLAVGGVFGVITLSDKKAAHCVDDVCDHGTTSAIKSSALVSDVGWIAGGVLLATGAALVLLAPGGRREGSASVKVAPLVTASGGGVVMGGSW